MGCLYPPVQYAGTKSEKAMEKRPETEADSAERQIRRRHEELAILHRLSVATSSTLEIDPILTILESLLYEELGVAGGCILLHHRASDQLQIRRHWGFSETMVRRLQERILEGEHLAPLRKGQQATFTANAGAELPWQLLGLAEERPSWRIAISIPLLAKNETLGLCCLFNQESKSFGQNKITFFETMGREVGIALYNARLFKELAVSRERLLRLAHSTFSTQEAERQRVARALHDEAGQALTGLKITLEMTRDDLPPDHVSREKLNEAIRLAESTMNQIRDLAHNLRPAALDNLGLNTTLQGFCRDFAGRTHLQINYSGTEAAPLPDAVEICLYRFLQEALTNAARHAEAEHVEVVLHRDDNTISLSVSDNGRGFDVEAALDVSATDHGIGLSGMERRVESVGGQLVIESEPGAGTRLVAWIPL